MTRIVTNEKEYKADASEAVRLAGYLLQGDKGYLDYVLELNRLGNKLVGEVWDTYFHVFGVLASDTDHLPTQKVRPHCSSSMLEKSDKELKSIIKFYKTDVTRACHGILSKYQNV